ncbi:hypothetical protein KAW38_03875 [Candidatus Micrarchaeota archaeon]|nr:hypothetical protein [Candidatus Micrarchaeota archaeon]
MRHLFLGLILLVFLTTVVSAVYDFEYFLEDLIYAPLDLLLCCCFPLLGFVVIGGTIALQNK